MGIKIYIAGDTYRGEFATLGTTGAAVNADSLPTAVMSRNGSDDGAVTLTVTNKGTGLYKVSGTIPSTYANGDQVAIWVSKTISAVVGKAYIDDFRLVQIGGTFAVGNTLVNHDTGGADALRVIYSNQGVSGAILRAYLSSEWTANQSTAVLRGSATTGSDGRWLMPIYLSSGATYEITAQIPSLGNYVVSLGTVTI